MKAIAVPQPWAAAAVFGRVEVINTAARTRHTGPILVCASGRDPRVRQDKAAAEELDTPLASAQNALVGTVWVTGCAAAGDVQLPFAVGPQVLTVHTPMIFPEPIPWPKFKGVQFFQLAEHGGEDALLTLLTPAMWAGEQMSKVSPNEHYPRGD